MAPDSEFETGRLSHLVVGNRGRLLDARRTPVRVVGLRPELAFFEVEVLDFEDKGARWEFAMDSVGRFQFAVDAAEASAEDALRFAEASRRFDEVLDIAADEGRRHETLARVDAEREAAVQWFEHRSIWARGDRVLDVSAPAGDGRLFADVSLFMASRGLGPLEAEFGRRYVSHPGAGELVKGHAIVAAELGLAAYRGPAVRDPATFAGDWSRKRRAEHLLSRLGFVQALFSLANHRTVDLYRGMSFADAINWRPDATFVSVTFDRSIAEAQSELGPHRSMGVLLIQRVAVERILMTYHETEAMNSQFLEAEALVLASPSAVF